MIYRLSAAVIVLFWAVMTTLLIRSRVAPDRVPDWMKVPVEQVVRHYFTQGEESSLFIYHNKLNYGQLILYPRREQSGESHLTFSGDVLVYLPGQKPQRIDFNGAMEFQPDFAMTALLGRVHLRDPGITLRFELQPAADAYSYEVLSGDYTLHKDAGTIESLMDGETLSRYGINLKQLTAAGQHFHNVEVNARTDELQILNDTIPTHRIAIKHSEDIQTVMHISQTGKLLRVDTPFGYTLLAGGLDP
jgi:hypothetical protein